MKILIVGGAGYIGSCCTQILLDQGHTAVVYDSLVKGHREAVDPRARFIQGDLADRNRVFSLLEDERPDGIIHFGAFIEVGESMQDPGMYFRNNVANGLNLVDAAVAHGNPKIVFSSTAAVYGMPKTIPIPETEPAKPISPYGDSKYMFERILNWYHQIHDLPYVALRYFNAAGATDKYGEDHSPESHLIPNVLKAATGEGEGIKMFGDDYPTPDGTCVRDYIHIRDLAQAHLDALEKEAVGSFNLGSGTGYSVKEIIDVAREVTGTDIPVTVAPRRPGDPPQLISDSTEARRVLGWTPQHDDIQSIVGSAWAWRKAHPHGYDE